MEKIFYIKDSIENKISYYHLLFFMLSLPFDRLYSTLILISLLLHTVIFFKREQLQRINRTTLLLQSVFFITLVSLTWAAFFTRGLEVAVKQLAILLFPLLIGLSSLDLKKYRNPLLYAFSIGCTVTVLYLYADALHIIYFNKLPLKSLFSAAFVNHNFSEPINMHATYLSMLLMLCLTWLLQQIFTGVSRKQRILFISCSAVLAAGLVQAASKSVLIASLFIGFAGFPWLVIKKTHRGRFLLTSLLLAVLLLSVLLSAAVFRNRYMTTLENDLQLHTGITKNDSRVDRWNAALELIKNAPLAGTGSGSDISLLKEIYFERKMYAAYLNNVNVHNQYLAFLIDAGIAGLLVYGCTLAWACWQSVRQRDIMLFAFTALVVVVSFSEDLLDVNKGIFFYAFFFSFFVPEQKPAVAKYISSGRQPAARINEL